MGNPKCLSCGLTNFATAQTCRRCGQPITPQAPQQVFYQPPAANYLPPPAAPPPPLPSVWPGHQQPLPPPESYYPTQPPPASYYPNQPQQWQPPPPPGQLYNPQWQAPPQWQNPSPPMTPAYVAGYGQPPAYAAQNQWVAPKPELNGIGGWLVLPAIGIVIRPLVALFGVFACLAFFGAGETIIANIGLKSYQQLRPIVGFELISNLFMAGFCIYVALLFFRKKSLAPKLYIVMLFAQVVMVTIDALLMNFLYAPVGRPSAPGSESSPLVLSFIFAGIWTAYFTKSVRVKNTFVN